MMADALGRPVTICTEPEPAARGAAVWALEAVAIIAAANVLPASWALCSSRGLISNRLMKRSPPPARTAKGSRMTPTPEQRAAHVIPADLELRAARIKLLLMGRRRRV
jgi:hypothetical protein